MKEFIEDRFSFKEDDLLTYIVEIREQMCDPKHVLNEGAVGYPGLVIYALENTINDLKERIKELEIDI